MSTSNTYITAEELGVQNHICVLPCGEESESGISKWTAEDLKPYQFFSVNGLQIGPLFRGLIFNPVVGRDNHFLQHMSSDFGQPAKKKDWSLALNRLFLEDYNFDAAATNTKPGEKTDIWVTLPYPNPLQTSFGELQDTNLNFRADAHRVAAMKWWMNKFLKKWERSVHLHNRLSFKGFVWPKASINKSDEELVKRVTAHIRKKGYRSLWLQQYGSSGCIEWQAFGFDAACTHPNYYGEVGPDYLWIVNSSVFAKYYRTGMQITFGKGDLFKKNHEFDYLNYGVYNDFMTDSLLVFQFPNQTMQEIAKNNPILYTHLYAFIKKTYKPVYPTAAFPS